MGMNNEFIHNYSFSNINFTCYCCYRNDNNCMQTRQKRNITFQQSESDISKEFRDRLGSHLSQSRQNDEELAEIVKNNAESINSNLCEIASQLKILAADFNKQVERINPTILKWLPSTDLNGGISCFLWISVPEKSAAEVLLIIQTATGQRKLQGICVTCGTDSCWANAILFTTAILCSINALI